MIEKIIKKYFHPMDALKFSTQIKKCMEEYAKWYLENYLKENENK